MSIKNTGYPPPFPLPDKPLKHTDPQPLQGADNLSKISLEKIRNTSTPSLTAKPQIESFFNGVDTSNMSTKVLEAVSSAIQDVLNPASPREPPKPLPALPPPIPNSCFAGEDINRLYVQMQQAKGREITVPKPVYDSENCLCEPFLPEKDEVATLPPQVAEATELSLIRSFIQDDQFIALIDKMPRLHKVALISCRNLTGKGLLRLTRLKFLQHLISNLPITEREFSRLITFSSWEHLEILEIGHTLIDDQTLAPFPEKYPNLKVLNLSFCPNLTDQSVLTLAKLKKLIQIDLRGAFISLRGIDYLKSINKNVTLTLSEDQEEKEALSQHYFLFLHDFFYNQGLDYKSNNWEVDDWIPSELENVVNGFYKQKIKQKKISIEFNISREMWLEADLTLQWEAAQDNLEKLIPRLFEKVNWNRLGIEPTKDLSHWVFFLTLKLRLFTDVVELDLSRLGLTYFPQVLASQALFSKLESLDISGNKLTFLPPSFFCHAPRLKKFSFRNNQIHTLPRDLLEFWPGITEVDMRGNRLEQSDLPSKPDSLKNILF